MTASTPRPWFRRRTSSATRSRSRVDGLIRSERDRQIPSCGDRIHNDERMVDVVGDPVRPIYFGWQSNLPLWPGGVEQDSPFEHLTEALHCSYVC